MGRVLHVYNPARMWRRVPHSIVAAFRSLIETPVRHPKPYAKTRKGWLRREERKFVRSWMQIDGNTTAVGGLEYNVERIFDDYGKLKPKYGEGW